MGSSPHAPAPGTVLAEKYRVDRVLGEGGMGYVLAATHLHLDEPVALKLLHPHLTNNPDVVTRFMREAKAAIRIRSEHVVRALDVGRLADGTPYLVMEYLEGSDLDAMLRRTGPMPVERAVDFVLQACEALAEAHVQGMVHRDLKPANLFVTKRADGTDLLKVLDFGISKVTGAGGTDLGMTTSSAGIMGSPLYMPPEQMRSVRDVDARADIWALGVILYKLLTDTMPFDAESLPELCAKLIVEAPAPLAERRPDVPRGLAEAIHRCLEKDPRGRFATVADLAEAISSFASASGRESASRIGRVFVAAGVRSTARTEVLPSAARLPEQAETRPTFERELVTPRADDSRRNVAATNNSWGQRTDTDGTKPVVAPRRAVGLYITFAMLALGGVALFVGRSRLGLSGSVAEMPSTATAAAPADPPTATTATTATQAPTVQPSAPLAATSAPSPTSTARAAPRSHAAATGPRAGASMSATPSATPSVEPPKPVVTATASAAPVDLFNGRK